MNSEKELQNQTLSGNEKLFQEFPPVTVKEWDELIIKELEGQDYSKKLVWKTIEGFDVKPFYTSDDLSNQDLSGPSSYPSNDLTPGVANRWEIRQDIWLKDIGQINSAALDYQHRGVDAFGINTQLVKNFDDLKILLEGLDLSNHSIHFLSSGSYPKLLKCFSEYLKQNNTSLSQIKGSVNFDPISYFILHGEFYDSFEQNINELISMYDFVQNEKSPLKILNINAHYYHNSGANMVQELAFSFAHAVEYLSAFTQRGYAIDELLDKMMFSFATGSNYFFEIAKFRAARILWDIIVKQFKPVSTSDHKMFIHASGSIWNKTIYDPYVNMLRTTTETLSAAIAGVDSINVIPFDLPYKNPDSFSRRIARNQQIIVRDEAYIGKVSDPAAGSYYIETITRQLIEHAWDLFVKIEEVGGFINAFEKGIILLEIERVKQQRDMNIIMRKDTILGTNQYPNTQERILEKIEPENFNKNNLIPDGSPFGPALKPYRGAIPFEEIRVKVEKHEKNGNPIPKVFLITVGNLAMRKARATFISNFFGCAGYQIIDNAGFKTADDAVKAAIGSKSDIYVICSSDDEYGTLGVEIAQKFKLENPHGILIVAGNPTAAADNLKQAGVDDFIHVRTNIIECLNSFNQKLGIN